MPAPKSEVLTDELRACSAQATSILNKADNENRDVTSDEDCQVKALLKKGREIKKRLEEARRDELVRAAVAELGLGPGGDGLSHYAGLLKTRNPWAAAVAETLTKTAGQYGVKALTTGSIDVPAPLSSPITSLPDRPRRVVDLLLDREDVTTGSYTYLRQTVRTNNAAPVADNAVKPTSIFTLVEVEDRPRVVAHLSEPIPERLFADHADLVDFLDAEMYGGVLSAIESQVLTGNGTGENFTGLLNVSGTLAVPFATDILTTIRKARTVMENADEAPNAWLFNPSDLETIDLLRESGTAGQFITGAATATSNVFGDLPIVASPQLPAGTAVLGDWRQGKLIVREEARLDVDRSGELFTKNQVVFRCEGRWNVAWKRPRAFAILDLTA
jgi:HK97 family phage major capsid protein